MRSLLEGAVALLLDVNPADEANIDAEDDVGSDGRVPDA